MARIRLTKQELKKQREDLDRYERFLPTLTLKKLQLQIERNRVRQAVDEKRAREKEKREALEDWVAVFGEEAGISDMIGIEQVDTESGNVAGLEVPFFRGVRFQETSYDLFTTPLWVDRALSEVKELLSLREEIRILEIQLKRLEQELRTTVQRVNLFEQVKIPEARENIRAIRVFLGDQQAAAVVRGKISKAKTARRTERSEG